MDRLLFVSDIRDRYHCSAPTAKKRIRQMRHMVIDGHLAVYEWAVLEYERERMQIPVDRKLALRTIKCQRTEDVHIQKRRA